MKCCVVVTIAVKLKGTSALADLFDLLMEGSHFEEKRETIIKPPFAWTGSKARSIDHIRPLLPYRDVWVDVFGGSGIVTFSRATSKLEVFNDAFSGITDFYRCLKDEAKCKAVVEWLELMPYSREMFTVCKEEWKNAGDIVERAAKWYYMLVCSFGTLGRNFGRATAPTVNLAKKYHNKFDLFWPVHHRLKTVQIENQDWEQLVKDYDGPQTVFYMDPPYIYSDPGIYDQAWNLEKHKRLLQVIFELEGFVALSGYDNDLYNSMPWDSKYTWETQITASSKAHTETNNLAGKEGMLSKKATEVLWIKEHG